MSGQIVNTESDVLVEARPNQLTIDPAKTAVIVVDMQNDFVAEGGMFARAGLPISLPLAPPG